jgi:hypothetical protein
MENQMKNASNVVELDKGNNTDTEKVIEKLIKQSAGAMPDTRYYRVTPTMAQLFLPRNTKNRREKPVHVRALAAEITDGNWDAYNGESITFTEEGILADGQHRLKAIIESGIPTIMAITFGASVEAYKTLDLGAKRLAADALWVGGMTDGRNHDVAQALYQIKRLTTDTLHLPNTRLTPLDAEELLEEHADVLDFVETGRMAQKEGLGPKSIHIALSYLFSLVDTDMAEQFYSDFIAGTYAYPADANKGQELSLEPSGQLRRKLIHGKGAKSNCSKAHRRYVIMATIGAWNKKRAGRMTKSFVVKPHQSPEWGQ